MIRQSMHAMFVALCGLLVAGRAFAVVPRCDGGAVIEGLGALQLGAVVAAPDGSIYCTGTYENKLTVGSVVLGATIYNSCFILKLDAEGRGLWGIPFGGAGRDGVPVIAATPDGGVVVGGSSGEPMFVGGVYVQNAGYIAKFSADGTYAWGRTFPASAGNGYPFSFPYQLTVSSEGVTNAIMWTSNYGAFYTTLWQFDRDGNDLLTRTPLGGNGVFWRSLVAVPGGGIVAVGDDESAGPSTPGQPIVYRLGGGGQVLWARRLYCTSTGGNNVATAVAVDSVGAVLVAGTFQGGLSFSDPSATIIAPSNAKSSFVMEMSPEGGVRWGNVLPSVAGQSVSPKGIGLTPQGEVAVSGTMGGEAMLFGGRTISGGAGLDCALWTYGRDGSEGSLWRARGAHNEDVVSAASASKGSLIVFSTFNQALDIGSRSLVANLGYDAGAVLRFSFSQAAPAILSLTDVPNDQGGWLRLKFKAAGNDARGAQPVVTNYAVWQRVPAVLGAQSTLARSSVTPPGDHDLAHWTGYRMISSGDAGALPEGQWEVVASVPAIQGDQYAVRIPTTADSSGTDAARAVCVVTAHAAATGEWFVSGVDSASSVDNLAPLAPRTFALTYRSSGTQLDWSRTTARDAREYRVYREMNPGFVPSSANLRVVTRDTTYLDATSAPYTYKVVVVDVHGNQSPPLTVGPSHPVATLIDLVQVLAGVNRIKLEWLVSGGSDQELVLERQNESGDWSEVARLLADGAGKVLFEDHSVSPAQEYRYRLSMSDAGANVVMSEVVVHTPRADAALELVSAYPNPSNGSRLRLGLVSPVVGAMRLQIVDLLGRVVHEQELHSGAVGGMTADVVPAQRLRPGVYSVRLQVPNGQGTSRRIVVVE